MNGILWNVWEELDKSCDTELLNSRDCFLLMEEASPISVKVPLEFLSPTNQISLEVASYLQDIGPSTYNSLNLSISERINAALPTEAEMLWEARECQLTLGVKGSILTSFASRAITRFSSCKPLTMKY